MRLLALATAASYRHTGLLAKTVTTLDVLSGERAIPGIGAGDCPEEAQGLGLPFPPLAEHIDMLEETLQVCQRICEDARGDEHPFHGAHVRLERALNVPQGLSRPTRRSSLPVVPVPVPVGSTGPGGLPGQVSPPHANGPEPPS